MNSNYSQENQNKNRLVLAVDDAIQNLQMIGEMLSEKGIDVAFATNGKQALSTAASSHPDLILLDISMPEMDGYTICEKLKNDPDTSDIPIIFLTGKTEPEDIVKGFQAGGVDYVTKPFRLDELFLRIDTHLELKKSREIILKQNKDLIKMNEQLRELVATKEKLFSIISHDLRGPFNTFISFTDMIANGPCQLSLGEIIDLTRSLSNSLHGANTLLENLLEWSRLQKGKFESFPDNINIHQIVKNVFGIFENIAIKKNISLNNEVNEKTAAFADHNMINTVIRNLIYNALKFTNSGGSIKVQSNEKESYIEIRISDTGLGICDEKLEKMFKIDSFESTRGTDNEKGSGIGLILCKEMVEKNKGKIWVESKLGTGSSFIFSLPKPE